MAALCLAALLGCDARTKDCDFRCRDRICAEGFECNADGWCVVIGSRADCLSSGGSAAETGGQGGGAGMTSIGEGGAGKGGTGGAASGSGGASRGGTGGAAVSGSGGASRGGTGGAAVSGSGGDETVSGGSAGGGGQPPTPCELETDELAIVVANPSEYLCVESEATLALSAKGGVPPYNWELADFTDFTLSPEEGESVSIVGTPRDTTQVTLSLELRDSCGRQLAQELALEVRAAPYLTSATLPQGCAGHLYLAQLDIPPEQRADGVSAVGLPKGLSLNTKLSSPALVGEAVRIEGTLEEAGPHSFDVLVSNGCGSAEATFQLLARRKPCPIAPPYEDNRPSLRSPCLGNYYRGVVDAAADFAAWEVIEKPSWLDFEGPTRATSVSVSGTAESSGNLIFKTIIDNEYVVAGFPLEVRETCWFAYLSKEDGLLRLIDPILGDDFGKSRLLQQPDVLDFAFSPDGRFLAYRVQRPAVEALPSRRSLFIVNLRTWDELPLPFEGDVAHYSWSASGLLAVASGVTPNTLFGLDVSRVTWRGAETQPPLFTPVRALVHDALTWIGDTSVAFVDQVPSGANSRQLYLAALTGDGFATPQAVSQSYVEPVLNPTTAGLFVTDWPSVPTGFAPLSARLDFIAPRSPGVNPMLYRHHHLEVVSEDGLTTGRVIDGGLHLFRSNEETLGAQSGARIPQCAKLLAWSQSGNRVACLNATSESGTSELRLSDLSGSIDASRLVPGTGDYTIAASRERPRAFSPNGDWFAYAAAESAFLVDAGDTPSIRSIEGTPNATDIEFSPDGSLLILRSGGYLVVASVSSPDEPPGRFLFTRDPAGCVEEFARRPGAWCGRAGRASPFRWAADAALLAISDSSSMLRLFDFINLDRQPQRLLIAQTPVTSFAFQPARRREKDALQ